MSGIQLPDNNTMYEALVNRNASFEGVFIAGIKTTGIFCRPTCHARKPNKENVEYFSNVKEALSFGYRPCKVCLPLTPLGEVPSWLKSLLKEVSDNPDVKFKDQDLRERGLEPSRVRRWFKKQHNMTFQAYTRAIRINRAFGQINHADKSGGSGSILDTALDSGFQSLSGFNNAYKNITGKSPGNSSNNELVTVTRILTPLGPMLAGATCRGVCLLEFTDRRMLETQIKRLSHLLKAKFIPGDIAIFSKLNDELNRYFAGQLKSFSVSLDVPGTEFQQKVWRALSKIPYGHTRSYQQQAIAINNEAAVRAVAKANGDNRISIIIPCHRVIGKNGQLTGYGGGLWRKQRLLELEQQTGYSTTS